VDILAGAHGNARGQHSSAALRFVFQQVA